MMLADDVAFCVRTVYTFATQVRNLRAISNERAVIRSLLVVVFGKYRSELNCTPPALANGRSASSNWSRQVSLSSTLQVATNALFSRHL